MNFQLLFCIVLTVLVPGFLPAQEVYKIPQGLAVIELRTADVPPDWETNDALPKATAPEESTAPLRFIAATKGDLVYQRLDFKEGPPEEVWWVDGWLGWKDRSGKLILFDASKPINEGPHPGFFSQPPALPGLGWVAAELLFSPPKEKAAADAPYRYFAMGEDGSGSPVKRAWVDAASGVPVAAQRGRLFFVYRFGGNVSVPGLPPELAEKLKAQKKIKSFIETMRKRRTS